jgi:hypothetical protein
MPLAAPDYEAPRPPNTNEQYTPPYDTPPPLDGSAAAARPEPHQQFGIYVFDWDQTLTINATNDPQINYGLDLIDPDEAHEARLARLRPGTRDALRAIIENGHKIIIATNHVFPEVIRHHLAAIFSADEIDQHVVIEHASESDVTLKKMAPAPQIPIKEMLFAPETPVQTKRDWFNASRRTSGGEEQNKDLFSIKAVNKNKLILSGVDTHLAKLFLDKSDIAYLCFFDDKDENTGCWIAYCDATSTTKRPYPVIVRDVNAHDGTIDAINGFHIEPRALMDEVLAMAARPFATLDLSDLTNNLATRKQLHGLIRHVGESVPVIPERFQHLREATAHLKKMSNAFDTVIPGRQAIAPLNPTCYLPPEESSPIYCLSNTIVVKSNLDDADGVHGFIILNEIDGPVYKDNYGDRKKPKYKQAIAFRITEDCIELSEAPFTIRCKYLLERFPNTKSLAIQKEQKAYELLQKINFSSDDNTAAAFDEVAYAPNIKDGHQHRMRLYQATPYLGRELKRLVELGVWEGLAPDTRQQVMLAIIQKISQLHTEHQMIHGNLCWNHIHVNLDTGQVYLTELKHAAPIGDENYKASRYSRFFKQPQYILLPQATQQRDRFALAGILALLCGADKASLKPEAYRSRKQLSPWQFDAAQLKWLDESQRAPMLAFLTSLSGAEEIDLLACFDRIFTPISNTPA